MDFYREYGFNGNGVNDMGCEFAALMPQKRIHRRARKAASETRIMREIGCVMALVVGVTFFILSYL